MCAHMCTHTHPPRLARDPARRGIIPAGLQSILTNTEYVPSCPRQPGSWGRLRASQVLERDPGSLQQRGSRAPSSPRPRRCVGSLLHRVSPGESDSQPGTVLAASAPLRALPARPAAQDEDSV